jgi:hypothetical protein
MSTTDIVIEKMIRGRKFTLINKSQPSYQGILAENPIPKCTYYKSQSKTMTSETFCKNYAPELEYAYGLFRTMVIPRLGLDIPKDVELEQRIYALYCEWIFARTSDKSVPPGGIWQQSSLE